MALLLSGGQQEYLEEKPTDPIEVLKAELDTLRHDFDQLFSESAVTKSELAEIKQLLYLQFQAFQQSFGNAPGAQAGVPSSSAEDKWRVIKQRFAPRLQEAIDILLLQGPMRRTQLSAAMKMDYSNCNKNVLGVLMRQGLLVETNGMIGLKQL